MNGNTSGITPSPVNPALPISTGSLLLYYDATKLESYPTTGSNWFQLVSGASSGNTIVFNSTPTYTTNNFGELTTNGSTIYGNTDGVTYVYSDSVGYSIGGWFQMTASGLTGTLYSRGGGYNFNPGWSMSLSIGTDDKITFTVVTGYDAGNFPVINFQSIKGLSTLQINKWYYIFGVYDYGSNLRLYLNGNLDGMTFTTNTRLFGGSGWNVGCLNSNSGISDKLAGTFGDYEIYQTSLSGSVVLNNFNAKTGSYNTSFTGSNPAISLQYKKEFNNNTGSIDLYINRGSGFVKEISLSGSTSNDVFTQSFLSPGNTFYATSNNMPYVLLDRARMSVYNNETLTGSFTSGFSIPESVTSTTYTAITGSLFTIIGSGN
jgi:hypothetical protein